MAISLKHSFTSAVADEGDASVVQPSNWNAEHTMTVGTGTLVGRTTAGTGAIEEITVGSGLSFASLLLNTSSLVPLTSATNTFTAKQILSGDGAVNAPLNLSGSYTPSSLVNGDIFFASNRLKYRQASTTYEVPRFDTTNTWTAQNSFSNINVTGGAITGITDLAVADGGTGASTAADARTNLGLGTLATQSGTFSGTSSGTNTGDQTITLTGDVTGSGTGSFAATIASLAVTTEKIADGAATLAKLDTTGTSGYVLTAQGSGVDPVWSAPAGSTLLGTITTTSGASQSLTSLDLTSYSFLMIVVQGISHNSGSNQSFLIGTSTADDIIFTGSVTGATLLRGILNISLSIGTITGIMAASAVSAIVVGGANIVTVGGDCTIVNASTSVSFAPNSGSFDAGSILVYGVR